MCLTIRGNNPELINRANGKEENIYVKALDLSVDDGVLSELDVAELESIAKSDGNFTRTEDILIANFKSKIAEAKKGHADGSYALTLDEAREGIVTNGETSVTTKSGTEITLVFSDKPNEFKKVNRNIDKAYETLDTIIPQSRRAEWDKLNKYDLAGVKKFIDSLNIDIPKKLALTEAYATLHFEHPGSDIRWGGSDNLQEALDAMKPDKYGRKFLDCEGFIKLFETMMGKNDLTVFTVAFGATGKDRDHQVAVFKNGNDFYVISNNEVKKVKDPVKNDTNSEMINSTFGFKNVEVDKNRAMIVGTEVFHKGQKLDKGALKINNIVDDTTFEATIKSKAGNFHVKGVIEPTGKNVYTLNAQKGDVLKTQDGGKITISSTNPDGSANGVYQDNKGTRVHVKVSPNSAHVFDFEAIPQKGDRIKYSNGSVMTMISDTEALKTTKKGESAHGRFENNNFIYDLRKGDVLVSHDGNNKIKMIDHEKGILNPGNKSVTVNVRSNGSLDIR